MSLDAYRKTQTTVASPRQAEYLAFSEITRALMEAEAAGPDALKARIEAVHANRQLWGALASDCADERNLLPEKTRAQIIVLSRWVASYSSDAMRKRESLEPLVDVNKIIMEGLAARRPAA
ncbi:MAG: flagellar biosynthesis regulator FlaF [Parvularculaceae bacterium]